MDIIVVIPAYNEERTVGEVVRQTMLHASCFMLQVVVVDDGSIDRTATVAREAGALVLRHPINRGLGAALSTGIEGALRMQNAECRMQNGRCIIVTLDADGQHDPAAIPQVIKPILDGLAEAVVGTRFKCKMKNEKCKIPLSRRVADWCGNAVTWLLFGIWVSDSQSGFRAFSGKAAGRLQLRTSTMEVSSEIIREVSRLKLKIVEVPITVKYNAYSLSKGQGFLKGLETLWKLIVLKFFR